MRGVCVGETSKRYRDKLLRCRCHRTCTWSSSWRVLDKAAKATHILYNRRKPELEVGNENEKNMRLLSMLLSICLLAFATAYDPKDESLKDILLPDGEFEAFYRKGPQSEEENAARPAHLHGSFNKYRNPALVGAPNSAAYGFRFDGKRRFNYD